MSDRGGLRQQELPFRQRKQGEGERKPHPVHATHKSLGVPSPPHVSQSAGIPSPDTASPRCRTDPSVEIEPMITEAEEAVEKALRSFDMDMKFGPCIGLSRLDRWHRAQRLGLGPPQLIRTLLEGVHGDLEKCLWEGRV